MDVVVENRGWLLAFVAASPAAERVFQENFSGTTFLIDAPREANVTRFLVSEGLTLIRESGAASIEQSSGLASPQADDWSSSAFHAGDHHEERRNW